MAMQYAASYIYIFKDLHYFCPEVQHAANAVSISHTRHGSSGIAAAWLVRLHRIEAASRRSWFLLCCLVVTQRGNKLFSLASA